jgi:hypothetical protein
MYVDLVSEITAVVTIASGGESAMSPVYVANTANTARAGGGS